MATSEYAWPTWVDWISETMEHLVIAIVESVSMIFGASSNLTSTLEPAGNLAKRSLFFLQNAVGTLSFDHFQLQLLKIFVLILISTGILICAAWHIYGQRISERFMHSGHLQPEIFCPARIFTFWKKPIFGNALWMPLGAHPTLENYGANFA